MTEEQFDLVVDSRIIQIKETLQMKGREYRRNSDPLHNFEVAARLGNTTREKALWGFALKHYVSFMDMLDDVEKGNLPELDKVDEKLGDLINYLILCEASIKDKIDNQDIKF